MTIEFRGYREDKIAQRLDVEHLRRLWPFARPYRGRFAVCLVILLASFGLEVLGPFIVRWAIDGPVTSALNGQDLDLGLVAGLGAAYLGSAVLGAWFGYAYALLTARTGQCVVRDLRVHLFRHLFLVGLRFHDRNPAGKLVTRVTSDVENLNELISTGVLQTVFDLLKIVGILSVLFWLDVELALFGVVVVPILAVVSLWFRKYARDAYRSVRGRLAKQNAFTAEMVGGVRAIRAYGRESAVQDQFDSLNDATCAGWRRTIFWFAAFFAIVELTLRLSQAGLLFVGGRGILAGTVTAGMFVQFWLYFIKLGEPIRELGEKYNVLQSAFSSSERIFGILGERPTPPPPTAAVAPGRGPATVEFEAVDFEYLAGSPVLRGVSFEIPAGTTCAIIGPTGAGKSTILGLVSRLDDPTRGIVRVDGHDLRTLDLDRLRQRIAVVPQDVFLFSGTILENLRLFDPAIPVERVRKAVDTVGAADFVDALDGGLEAQVEERGATFSQGERQLLAMARALCHDPDILILDEATANIDSASEARIQRALEVLFADRTVLVVAHRLSTVERADQVLVVRDGAVSPLRSRG